MNMNKFGIGMRLIGILIFTWFAWFFWPWLSEFFGGLHCSWIAGIHDKTSKEELSQVYTIFQAWVAVVSIGVAFVMYILGKEQARDDEFNKLLMKELEHLFVKVDEWAVLQDSLSWSVDGKVIDGYFVSNFMADKYRKAELALLVKIHGEDREAADKAIAELNDQDRAFMADFDSAKLKPMADVLFRILNWSWAIVGSLERVYSRDKSRMREIADFQEKIIGIVRDYIGPDSQYVFGRYRHVKWKLDEAKGKVKPAYYRGERSADRLFVYERTLALYTPSPQVAKLQIDYLATRNAKLGLPFDLQIDFKKRWQSALLQR